MEIIKQFIYCPFFISFFEEPEIFVEKQQFYSIFCHSFILNLATLG